MTTDHSRRELELYEILLDIDAEARTAYLDRECEGDPELRRRVESLLEVPSAFLGSPAVELALEVRKSGSRIGDFRIERWLGGGGMGEVYLASDTHLRRTVAIKIVSARLGGGDSWRKQLLTESQTIPV